MKTEHGLIARWGRCWAIALALALLGCGGGSEDSPSASATLDADGGKLVAASAEVLVPQGALSEGTTLRIAEDSTGAPALPPWARSVGAMVQLTPHGGNFAEPVTVRLNAPDVPLADNERLLIAKAQPGGSWEVLGDTERVGGWLQVQVSSFSYFAPVIVRFDGTLIDSTDPSVLRILPPFAMSPIAFSCGGTDCATPVLLTSTAVTATSSGNGGAFPVGCVNPMIQVRQNGTMVRAVPATSSMALSHLIAWSATSSLYGGSLFSVSMSLTCTDAATNAISLLQMAYATIAIDSFSAGRTVPTVRRFPSGLTKAPGETLTWSAVLKGGASFKINVGSFQAPTATDQATVYLERMTPGDGVWRIAASRGQFNANPQPTSAQPWAYWGLDFALGAVSAADNGTLYRIRACYQLPGATTASCNIGPVATLTVVQQTVLPTFQLQPQSLQVLPGQTASFSARADGTPLPTLAWETRAVGQAAWSPASGTGTTSGDYTTGAVSLADHGRQYRLLASNAAGTAVSEVVTLSVTETPQAPSITAAPLGLTVVAGSEAVFAVTAQGTAPLSYQWLRNGVPLAGANGTQLQLAPLMASDAGTIAVRVSNTVGSVTSTDVALIVNAAPSTAPVAPSIVTQPAAVAVSAGNVATFAVGVTGSGPLSFQWRRNGQAIAGATAAAYTLAAVSADDAGDYSVVVSNSAGSVTSRVATLAVAPAAGALVAPTITTQPVSVVVVPFSTTTLAVAATGSGPLSYQWFQDGSPISQANGPTLTFDSLDAVFNGRYTVTVSNAAGSVTSAAAELLVVGAPQITQQPQATSVTEGSSATFSVQASGNSLRYLWTRNGLPIADATSASVTLPALTLADSGAVFAVIVYNGAGIQLSSSAVLTVTAAAQQGTTLASRTNAGGVPDDTSHTPSLSTNGRRVAFISEGSNLVVGGAVPGGAYVRDLDSGSTVQVNRTLAGEASTLPVGAAMKLSANGRYVIFSSADPNLVAGDTNGAVDVFVRDLELGSTVRVNVRSDGGQTVGNASGVGVDISADGRRVLFQSAADLMGTGDALPGGYRWYVRDLQTGGTTALPAWDDFNGAVMSGDGLNAAVLIVDFSSYKVLVADREGSVRTVLSIPLSDGYVGGRPALSHDGRYVAFAFRSASLLGGAAATADQIGLIDTWASNPAASLELVSRSAAGQAGDGRSSAPRISADGRYVLFLSRAPALTSGAGMDCCGPALALRDRTANTTVAASLSAAGSAIAVPDNSTMFALSADGSRLAFYDDIALVQGAGTPGGWQVFTAPRP